ncbi:oligosaccharide flippase family protein [Dechloromonas sp. XY25]|uniref:Oligosaccharide flippase family protein n=1 Tax=Dechloromonas hankyongensis TaxID=2908002 RepID=A0ABS9K1G7_9RHOO|nr:oligosaccharide flippase family protein [Dechloromonas hankyongensis]MCG2576998.1 oligosaccharide flippase family protein [Dechloromonas hankyongensis]
MTATGSGPMPTTAALHRRALSLGTVNAVGYAVQFVLPVVLARFLSAESFGEYRLIWLAIMTAMSFVPMEMHGVLYYFLPRATPAERRLYVRQTWLYLAVAGSLAALAVSPLNPWLPDSIRTLGPTAALLPALVFLYAATLLLDTLPTIEERLAWQAAVTLSLALLRALVLSAAAWLTGDLVVMLWLLLAVLLLKAALLGIYVARHHGLAGPWLGWRQLRGQLGHAAPFGLADALYQLRAQAGLWVAAGLFPLGQFAAFSIATMLGPLVNLCRQSVNHVFLPSMSRLHAAADFAGTIRLNSQANSTVSLVAYPLLAFTFVFAEELIGLVFTPDYLAAAPAMRVFALGLTVLLVELSSLTLLHRDGLFVLRINALLVVVSAGISWLAAHALGLPGAALGSVAALLVDRALTLRRIARHTGIPIRRLQDWTKLARLLGCVVVAGLSAWQISLLLPTGLGAGSRLVLGGLALTGIYGALLNLNGDLPKIGAAAAPCPSAEKRP